MKSKIPVEPNLQVFYAAKPGLIFCYDYQKIPLRTLRLYVKPEMEET